MTDEKLRIAPSEIWVGDLLADMDWAEVRSVTRAEDGKGWVIETSGNLPHYYAPGRRLTVIPRHADSPIRRGPRT